jgi:hypothetical protein
MSWRFPFVRGAVLVAAALVLSAPPVLGGDRVHSSNRQAVQSQPAPVAHRVVLSAESVALSVTLTTESEVVGEPAYVTLRGPDGQLRRFPVEGGAGAVPARIVVLRPGESVSIRVAAK